MAVSSAVAVRTAVGRIQPMVGEDKTANSGGAQAGAGRINAAFTRVTLGGTGYSLVLPNLITGEAGYNAYIVSNETATTVVVFCALGDTLNGSANGSLTIAAGGFGIFVKRPVQHFSYVAPDWAAGAVV